VNVTAVNEGMTEEGWSEEGWWGIIAATQWALAADVQVK